MIRQFTPKELSALMKSGTPVQLIDVRGEDEREICSLGGTLIPLPQLAARMGEIPRDGTVVLYCRSGGRSARAIEGLQTQHGYTNLMNLAGGILRWIEEIDPSMTRY